jgi:hypothetical protein
LLQCNLHLFILFSEKGNNRELDLEKFSLNFVIEVLQKTLHGLEEPGPLEDCAAQGKS